MQKPPVKKAQNGAPWRSAKMTALVKTFGGQDKMAGLLGLTRQAIQKWRDVPPQHALELERLTKGKFSAHALAPDHYPKWLKTWPRPKGA